ncbi:MAG: hypothetical protein DWQ19_09015 [Crenarchaeota archaeon]|nr:MAG: hypothetical protein DWQ19_09015 [Thermoproteota archaeon]
MTLSAGCGSESLIMPHAIAMPPIIHKHQKARTKKMLKTILATAKIFSKIVVTFSVKFVIFK